MAETSTILQIRQVSAARPAENGEPQTILCDVSLTCRAGEVVAVAGPSGSGKSTLLRLCNRLLEPTAGEVYYDNRDVCSLAPPELRQQVALVAQKPFLYKGTVRENLTFPARLTHTSSPDFSSQAARDILALCQVDRAWLERDGRRLSVGQQQRVCLARALMGDCRVLLLDEPTSALDRPTAEALAQTFRDLASERGLCLLLVTHDLQVARFCADRLAVMIDGRIVEEGAVQDILSAPKSEQVKAFVGNSARSGERSS